MSPFLKESAAGAATKDLCRRHGICEGTFYRWKAKYGDMELSDVRRLKDLEAENTRLNKIVAEQALDMKTMIPTKGRNHQLGPQ